MRWTRTEREMRRLGIITYTYIYIPKCSLGHLSISPSLLPPYFLSLVLIIISGIVVFSAANNKS